MHKSDKISTMLSGKVVTMALHIIRFGMENREYVA